jgi:hypothetical protein
MNTESEISSLKLRYSNVSVHGSVVRGLRGDNLQRSKLS